MVCQLVYCKPQYPLSVISLILHDTYYPEPSATEDHNLTALYQFPWYEESGVYRQLLCLGMLEHALYNFAIPRGHSAVVQQNGLACAPHILLQLFASS